MAGQSKKKPLTLRIDRELFEAVERARGDVSRTRFVERALEKALGDSSTAEQLRKREPISQVAGSTPATPAPSRTSAKGAFDAQSEAMKRQARMNKAKGL